MAYVRFAPQADNRRAKQATVPIGFRNVYLEAVPTGAAKRSEFFVTSRPGMTRVADLGELCRGLFSVSGCRGGNLFAPAGGAMNEVFTGWAFSNIGSISGADPVIMRPYRDDLAYKAFATLRIYDGSSVTEISDIDAPASPGGLASVALRLVSFEMGAVEFYWSEAGVPTAWPSDAAAATPDLSDPIVGVEEIGEALWVFGARKIRPWAATGEAADADAFAKLSTEAIARGLAGVHAVAPIEGGDRMFLADNRTIWRTQGLGIAPAPNRSLELALKDLSASELADCTAWSFEDGQKLFWGLSSAALDTSAVMDRSTGLWADWDRYNGEPFIDFSANAFGEIVVGSRTSPYLWKLDSEAYTDDGDPLIREFTMHIASGGDVPVDRLVIDIETTGVPLSGDGSEPVMQVSISIDNGQNWDQLEDVELPHANDRFRPQLWGLGLADAQAGMLVKCEISAPFGFAAYGFWVNPSSDEITLA
jgi:hypothetical protein